MSRFCVSEGTMITLKDKTSKPIEEIIIGEELLVFDLETLQKSQKYDILVKLSTNDFRGIFQDSVVKNIWTNTSDKYYLINKKLKITGDHILLANREDKYYWTKVEKLELGDLLFTEMNIFEYIHSIEIINEKIDVYNLEVNTYYNYFANSYLIHNGAPCSACDACGEITPVLQTSPGGYIYQVPTGYNRATVTVKGAMGSISNTTVPENDPSGRGAVIVGSFTVSAGYIYYFVGQGDGSNFSGITGNGGGVTEVNYNGGGFGWNRRESSSTHGFKGGGCSFIAYSTNSDLQNSNGDSIINTTPTSSKELKDFDTDALKSTILVVAGGGGGQSSVDETGTESNTSGDTGGNGGDADGDASSDNSSNVNSGRSWLTDTNYADVQGTFIQGVKGVDNLDGATDRPRYGGEPGNKGGATDYPSGGVGGDGYQPWHGNSGNAWSFQSGEFGVGGMKSRDSNNNALGPGLDSSESAGWGWTSTISNDINNPGGGESILRGGGGGGGIYGGGAGSGCGGGGGGGLSYYKTAGSGTTFSYIEEGSGKRNAIYHGNTANTGNDPSSVDSADLFNGSIEITLSNT